MKTETIEALLIDREMGELPPETMELLDAWLAEHPESLQLVSSLRRTLETTSATVRRYPQLGRPETRIIALEAFRSRFVSLAVAASILILAGATAWLGFRAGREFAPKVVLQIPSASPESPAANSKKQDGPWKRYALVSNPSGGLTVVPRQ